MSFVGMLYIHASLCRTAIGVSLCHWSLLALWWYDEHIGVGLRRCSFRLARPFSGASNREASDSAGLHAFLCLQVNVKNTHT